MTRHWDGIAVMAAVVASSALMSATRASGQGDAQKRSRSARTRVIMLGTGTPAADPDRFGPAVVVLVDSTPYLFDMGVGVVRRWAAALRTGIAPLDASSLRTAFVTHLHSDHTLGYAELIFTSWTLEKGAHRPLDVYGPKGLQRMTDHLLAAYAEDIAVRTGPGGELEGSAPPVVRVHEIELGVVYRDSLVTVTAFPAHHGTWAQAFGYRIQTPDKVIVLSGDTGPPSEVVKQCHGCDLLLHEGGFRTDADASAYFRHFHTTAEELAAIAEATHPSLLVLYHQAPAGPGVERGYAKLRSLYAGPFVVAHDLDVFPLASARQSASHEIRVTLLGTGNPRPVMDRFGPSILVEAGVEKLLIDAGRGAAQRLAQLGVSYADITGILLTHLHSDHTVGLPDVWLTGWLMSGRSKPMELWGPTGTADMARNLEAAYAFDMDVRARDDAMPAAGARLTAHDIGEQQLFDRNGVKVTAFVVDHGPVRPALGYRIDYGGRSVVLSGDTRYSPNLIRFAKGTDVLIHEVAAATPDDVRRSAHTRTVIAHHITPERAGEVFNTVRPKLAVYSHIVLFPGISTDDLIRLTRTSYTGPLRVGEDLMRIHVGDQVTVEREASSRP